MFPGFRYFWVPGLLDLRIWFPQKAYSSGGTSGIQNTRIPGYGTSGS